MKNFMIFCFLFISVSAHAQSLSINTDGSTANASAMLDIKSTAKGLLIPRMTKAQRNAIASPAKGLMVFIDDVDSVGFHYYNGSSWLWIEALGNAGWKTKGNAGTDTALNFIGTTDAMPLRFKQNNQSLAQFNSNNGTYYMGKGAGAANTASGVIAIGDSALSKNTFATYNSAIGHYALKDNVFGTYLTAVGYQSLSKNNNGLGYNTALGSYTLASNVNGVASTAVGSLALANDTSIGYNTALGYGALQSNRLGYGNISVGQNSMLTNKTGNFNTAVGNNAMIYSDKTVASVALGSDALKLDTTGYNTAVGVLALANSISGGGNVSVGAYNLYTNGSGDKNTSMGYESLFYNSSGSYNVAIGDSAGYNNTTASSNIFIGRAAGASNQTRTNLLFIGDSTGFKNSVGSEQVFIGNYAGKSHRINSRNTFVGVYAGYLDSLGYNNTFIGEEAGYNNKGTVANTGIRNTFVGQASGYTNTTGNENTILGYNADVLSTGLNNATAIGANAAVNASNSLVLGSISGINGATANANVGIGTTTPGYALHVVNNNSQNGGWANGIMIENISSPLINAGEAAVSFRNIAVPTGYQWNIGMNSNPDLSFNYGNDFIAGNIKMVIDTFGNVGIGVTSPTAVLDVDGTYKLGTNGTKNTALIKDTVSINVGAVPANGELDVSVALPNVTLNGAVSISPAADIESGLVIAWARVSAAGTIKIRYRNLTAAIINPVTINYYISVVQ